MIEYHRYEMNELRDVMKDLERQQEIQPFTYEFA